VLDLLFAIASLYVCASNAASNPYAELESIRLPPTKSTSTTTILHRFRLRHNADEKRLIPHGRRPRLPPVSLGGGGGVRNRDDADDGLALPFPNPS
jgi:hypothetical protein